MTVALKLDLRGVVLPVSLLKFKSTLAQLEPEDALDVLVHDPEVARDVIKIITRSQERPTSFRKVGDHYRVHIEPLSPTMGAGPGHMEKAEGGRSGRRHGISTETKPVT